MRRADEALGISTERRRVWNCSRRFRWGVEEGSKEDSAVSQPPALGPLALSQGGRSFSIMAVQWTWVLPKEMTTEPPACLVGWRWIFERAELGGGAAVVAGVWHGGSV